MPACSGLTSLMCGNRTCANKAGKQFYQFVAIAFLVGDLATLALGSPLAQSYSSVETGIFLVDAQCLIAFIYTALIFRPLLAIAGEWT